MDGFRRKRKSICRSEIENILLEAEDEDLFIGEEYEDETVEIIQDFRLKEDIRTAGSFDALEPESPQDSDEELEASLQLDSNKAPVTVFSVHDV